MAIIIGYRLYPIPSHQRLYITRTWLRCDESNSSKINSIWQLTVCLLLDQFDDDDWIIIDWHFHSFIRCTSIIIIYLYIIFRKSQPSFFDEFLILVAMWSTPKNDISKKHKMLAQWKWIVFFHIPNQQIRFELERERKTEGWGNQKMARPWYKTELTL